MVGEISEVTQLLSAVVKQQDDNKEKIVKKNKDTDAKSYRVDSIENSK